MFYGREATLYMSHPFFDESAYVDFDDGKRMAFYWDQLITLEELEQQIKKPVVFLKDIYLLRAFKQTQKFNLTTLP